MHKNEDGSLTISAETAETIMDFIERTLDRAWDHHTNHYYGYKETWDQGMRRMDPEMYDLRERMIETLA